MKALLTSQAALGHFHPLAALADGLVARGHEVLFATAPCFCSAIRSAGFAVRAAGMDWSSRDLAVTWPEFTAVPASARNSWINQNVWADRLPAAMVPHLLDVVRDWRPDVIVSGRAEIAGPLVGELRDIPYATVSAGRVIALGDFVSQIGEGRERLRAKLGLPSDLSGESLYRYLYLNFIPRVFLPADELAWPTRHDCRPATFDRGGDHEIPRWLLDMGPRSVAYVSFGGNQGPQLIDVFRAAIAGLQGCGIDVVLTVGHGVSPEDVCDQLPGGIHVLRYVPQRIVLERAAIAICHGGINSILGALLHAVPLLVLPTEQSDQSWNAARCKALGVGTSLGPAEVSAGSIRAATVEVLRDRCYSEAAADFAEQLARLPSMEQAVNNVEELAEGRQPLTGGY